MIHEYSIVLFLRHVFLVHWVSSPYLLTFQVCHLTHTGLEIIIGNQNDVWSDNNIGTH